MRRENLFILKNVVSRERQKKEGRGRINHKKTRSHFKIENDFMILREKKDLTTRGGSRNRKPYGETPKKRCQGGKKDTQPEMSTKPQKYEGGRKNQGGRT